MRPLPGRIRHSTYRNMQLLLLLSVSAAGIGIAAGALDALMSNVLILLEEVRSSHPFYLIPFLPAAGILIIWIFQKWGRVCFRSMDHVFHAAHGEMDILPWRTIPLCIATTWLTHAFGGSSGRIAAAVPIGVTLASHLGRSFRSPRVLEVLTVAGIAAGFSGVFQTPLAAVFFAMEILAFGHFDAYAFLPAASASFSAAFTSSLLGLPKFAGPLANDANVTFTVCLLSAVCGIFSGAAGGSFAFAMTSARKLLSRHFSDPMRCIAWAGAAAAVFSLLCHQGRYSGMSSALTAAAFTGGAICWYDWIGKYVLTIITRASGFQGGDILPSLVIGASLGAAAAPLTGLSVPLMAACGAVGFFAGATNTFLAPFFFGMELFGWGYAPCFLPVCLLACVSNFHQSLYAMQDHAAFFRTHIFHK